MRRRADGWAAENAADPFPTLFSTTYETAPVMAHCRDRGLVFHFVSWLRRRIADKIGNNSCKQASLGKNRRNQAEKLYFSAKMQNPAHLTRFGKDRLDEKRDSLSTVSWCARRDLKPSHGVWGADPSLGVLWFSGYRSRRFADG